MSQYATKCSDALFKMLEKGKLSLHSNLLNEKNSDVRGEEHDTNPSCNTSVVMIGVPLTDASKMHMSNSVIRALPVEVYPTMPRSKILNPEPNPGHVLPGTLLPLPAPATGFVPATSTVKHLPHDHPSNSMRVCTAKEFCKHQKAIHSRNDLRIQSPWGLRRPLPTVIATHCRMVIYSYTLTTMDVKLGCGENLVGCQFRKLGAGEPSWVTRKTMATYRVKNRKCRP
ncbi:hypothetical protein EDC04DRAFT_2612460 [Pisolithus marmoratus]|nr:hypothetical protein EDC04DRAFT_2612460 [Pisolithus marmoratus]